MIGNSNGSGSRWHTLTNNVAEEHTLRGNEALATSGTLLSQKRTQFLANREQSKESSKEKNSFETLAEQETSDLPWRILLQALNASEGQYIGLDIPGLAVMGRSDPASSAQPDIDLTPYEGQLHGVSRHHAVLVPTDEGLCLIDLDSANGTWISGEYLQPGQKYRLRSGDLIELGSLKLLVRVLGSTTPGLGIRSTTQTRSKPPQR